MEQRRRASDTNKLLMERIYELINGGDLSGADEVIAEDMIEHEDQPDVEQGREGFKSFVQRMRSAFPDLRFTVVDMVAEDEQVAALVTVTGTHQGEFLGVAPTGREIRLTAIDIVRFADGRAAEHWGVTDAMTLMQQLGAVPSA
jgi:steroid delta-isomerase-like uncharacterized protein